MTDSQVNEVNKVNDPSFVIHFTYELPGLLQWGAEPVCEANGPEAYQAVCTDAGKVTCEDCRRLMADPAQSLAAIRRRADAAIPLPWSLERESCDCGGGYGCSHGSWPYCLRLPVPKTEHEDGKTRDYDFSFTEIGDFPMETAEFMVAARTDVPRLLAAVDAALKVSAQYENGCTRWAEPLPVPTWIPRLRAAVAAALSGQPAPEWLKQPYPVIGFTPTSNWPDDVAEGSRRASESKHGLEPESPGAGEPKPGGSMNPTPDCGSPRKPPGATELWWCLGGCNEFHEPAKEIPDDNHGT